MKGGGIQRHDGKGEDPELKGQVGAEVKDRSHDQVDPGKAQAVEQGPDAPRAAP